MDLNLKIDWREEEADGSPCCLCGDAIFLRAWRAVISANCNGTASRSEGTATYCTGCKDLLETGDGEGPELA